MASIDWSNFITTKPKTKSQFVLDQLVPELLLQIDALLAGPRHAVDGVHHEVACWFSWFEFGFLIAVETVLALQVVDSQLISLV